MPDDFKVTDKRGKETKTEEPKDATASNPNPQSQDIGFSNLILSLGTSAMIHLGIIEDPHTKQKDKNIEMAKQEIDLIVMLEGKTKGNLTEAEKKVVDQVLYELRLRYIEATK